MIGRSVTDDFRTFFHECPTLIAGYSFGSAATGEWRDGYSDYDFALFWTQPNDIDFDMMRRFITQQTACDARLRLDLFSYTPTDLPFASRFFQMRFIAEACHLFGRPVHQSLVRPDPIELRAECQMLLRRHVVLCRTFLLDVRDGAPQKVVDSCQKVLIEALRYWSIGHGERTSTKASVSQYASCRLGPIAAETIERLHVLHGETGRGVTADEAARLLGDTMTLLEALISPSLTP